MKNINENTFKTIEKQYKTIFLLLDYAPHPYSLIVDILKEQIDPISLMLFDDLDNLAKVIDNISLIKVLENSLSNWKKSVFDLINFTRIRFLSGADIEGNDVFEFFRWLTISKQLIKNYKYLIEKVIV